MLIYYLLHFTKINNWQTTNIKKIEKNLTTLIKVEIFEEFEKFKKILFKPNCKP